MEQWSWGNLTEREELKRWQCTRFIELKNIVHVATQIIDKNLFFRFLKVPQSTYKYLKVPISTSKYL